MILLRLMYEFCKTGLFAVGGGLATLPFLYEMAGKNRMVYQSGYFESGCNLGINSWSDWNNMSPMLDF